MKVKREKVYIVWSNYGPLDEVKTKKAAERSVRASGGACWYHHYLKTTDENGETTYEEIE